MLRSNAKSDVLACHRTRIHTFPATHAPSWEKMTYATVRCIGFTTAFARDANEGRIGMNTASHREIVKFIWSVANLRNYINGFPANMREVVG